MTANSKFETDSNYHRPRSVVELFMHRQSHSF